MTVIVQQPYIFNRTVKENLMLAKEDLTDEEFMKMNGNKEAQILFSMPVTKAMDDIFSLTMGSFGGTEDGD